jgi:hypothetical protein
MDPLPISPAESPTPTVARKVLWALPWYKASNPLTTFSVMANWDPRVSGATMAYNDAMIQHSRNALVDRFLNSKEEFQWLLFVDDDMVLPTGDPTWFKEVTGLRPGAWTGKLLEGLLRHDKTIVSALYVGRDPRGNGRPMFAEGDEPKLMENIRKGTAKGLRKVAWAGTGCLLIHRSVFLSIRERMPHLAPKAAGRPWHYFTPMADSAVALLEAHAKGPGDTVELRRAELQEAWTKSLPNAHAGEDVVFGMRAAEAGHPTYVDLDVVCGHQGVRCWGPSNTG